MLEEPAYLKQDKNHFAVDFFFFLKKDRWPHTAPHLDVWSLGNLTTLHSPTNARLEVLARERSCLYTLDRRTVLFSMEEGHTYSTECAALQRMHMEWGGRRATPA